MVLAKLIRWAKTKAILSDPAGTASAATLAPAWRGASADPTTWILPPREIFLADPVTFCQSHVTLEEGSTSFERDDLTSGRKRDRQLLAEEGSVVSPSGVGIGDHFEE